VANINYGEIRRDKFYLYSYAFYMKRNGYRLLVFNVA